MEPKKTPTAAIVGLIGGVILVIGSFLSWVTISFDVDTLATKVSDALGVPVSGSELADAGLRTQKFGGFDVDGKITLFFGVLAVIGAAILLARKSNVAAGILMLVGGLGGAGVATYDLVSKENQIDTFVSDIGPALSQLGITGDTFKPLFSVSWGIGIYACVLGGVVALIAGIMAFTSKTAEPAMPATAGEPAATGFGAPASPPAAPPAAAPAAPAPPEPPTTQGGGTTPPV
jgi:hypothetical protein